MRVLAAFETAVRMRVLAAFETAVRMRVLTRSSRAYLLVRGAWLPLRASC
jgi:hypothetical protein